MQVPKVTTSDASGHTCNHPCFFIPSKAFWVLACFSGCTRTLGWSTLLLLSSRIGANRWLTPFCSVFFDRCRNYIPFQTPSSSSPCKDSIVTSSRKPSLFSSLPISPWLSPKCVTSHYPRQWQVTQCTHSTVLLPSSSNTDVWQLKSSFQDLAYLVLLYCLLAV